MPYWTRLSGNYKETLPADVRLRTLEIDWSQNSDPQKMSPQHDDLRATDTFPVHQTQAANDLSLERCVVRLVY